MATIQFTFSKLDDKHYATANGQKFFIGTEFFIKGYHGLYNYRIADGPVYKPQKFEAQFGFWSWFIFPTAQCESNCSYHCLNTYDNAAFTFTFMQYAAHVPNGDFVQYFRLLLQLPEAKDYFPFLELRNNRIWYVRNTSANQLENDASSAALMHYLNSDVNTMDDQELISSARFVHWAQNSEAHRNLQVSTAVEWFKKNMKEYAVRFNLDGWPDYICHTICDILHQGRAKYSLITQMMQSSTNLDTVYSKLVNIGIGAYADRIATLKKAHKQLRDSGVFGKVYNAAAGEFE